MNNNAKNKSLPETIKSELEKMPAKARRVAEYVLSRPSELALLSIGEVAEKLAVSKSQLVRVARLLGFEGYAPLKEAVKESVIDRLAPSTAKQPEGGVIEKICHLEHANIDETASNLKSRDIDEFCKKIKNAGSIYCVGWGISALVVENLHTRLLELGLCGVLMKRGSSSLIEQVRAVKAGDLVVVCELPSYVIEVTECIKLASERGAHVITITDSPGAPVCRYAKTQFIVSDETKTFGSSIVGAIFLVHALTSVLAQKLGSKAKDALSAQLEGLNDRRVYHPSFGLKY